MQNKPNFMRFSPENNDFTKNKANSNPIKANSKPIQPKTNPIQTQSKPISYNMKFDHRKCLKLKPIMILSLRVLNKYSMNQKQYLEETS